MRQNSAETAERFKTTCCSGDLSRTALAHEICVQENRFGRVGRLCLASARKLLPHLAEQPRVGLPEAEAMEVAPYARPPPDFADGSVSCSIRELGPLSLERVASSEQRRRWEAMIETHHPEGWRRLRGSEPSARPHGEADPALHAGGPASSEGPGE